MVTTKEKVILSRAREKDMKQTTSEQLPKSRWMGNAQEEDHGCDGRILSERAYNH